MGFQHLSRPWESFWEAWGASWEVDPFWGCPAWTPTILVSIPLAMQLVQGDRDLLCNACNWLKRVRGGCTGVPRALGPRSGRANSWQGCKRGAGWGRGRATSEAVDAAARAGGQRGVRQRFALEVEPQGAHDARAAVAEDDLGRLTGVDGTQRPPWGRRRHFPRPVRHTACARAPGRMASYVRAPELLASVRARHRAGGRHFQPPCWVSDAACVRTCAHHPNVCMRAPGRGGQRTSTQVGGAWLCACVLLFPPGL